MRPLPCQVVDPRRGRPGAVRESAWIATAALLLTAACRCGEPVPPRVFEVGAPLADLPTSRATALPALVPARAALVVVVDDPLELLKLLKSSPRFAAFADPAIAGALAHSDSGATFRALSQRLSELSQLPSPAGGFASLLDGPLALAARAGPDGGDLLVVKRLSPRLAASWKLAQMLQAVHPSLKELRVERYRGLPLRKALAGSSRRVTYFVLRDLLVAGTSEAWVKQSLDLALDGAGASAAAQPALSEALANSRGALLAAAVDTEALRGPELERPDLVDLLLTEARWARLVVARTGTTTFALAQKSPVTGRAGRPGSAARAAPKGTLAAVSRAVDLSAALKSLLPERGPEGTLPDETRRLRAALLERLAPALGGEAFWLTDGFDHDEHRPVWRHVLGASLADPAGAARALSDLAPDLLAPPLEKKVEAGHETFCGGEGPSLCLAVAHDLLLVANRLDALHTALATLDAQRAPAGLPPTAAATGDLVFLDAAGLAGALSKLMPGPDGERADPDPRRERTDRALAALRGIGPLVCALASTGPALLSCELRPP